ncbi:MAG: hypothetical protein HOA17_03450 [Candidatus Melainabacteria bacterium]|nr:hypothetical protein [Candidatus Melainabacteria bacterium]
MLGSQLLYAARLIKPSQLLTALSFENEENLFTGDQELDLEITTTQAIKKVLVSFSHKQAKKNPNKRTELVQTKELVSEINGNFLYQLKIPFDQTKELGEWFLRMKIIDKNNRKVVYKTKKLKNLVMDYSLNLINEEIIDDTGATNQEEPTPVEEEPNNSNTSSGSSSGGGSSPPPVDDPTVPPAPEPESLLQVPSLNPSNGDALDNISLLYNGTGAVQTGVDETAIDEVRASIIRGKVFDHDGKPMTNVLVTIHHHSEFGQTQTMKNGEYNMVVNGGIRTTMSYRATGFSDLQRTITIPSRDLWVLDDVYLTKLDSKANAIDLNVNNMQVTEASVCNDEDGERQAVLIIPPQTGVTMILPNGSSLSLESATVRATEYTVGANGQNAMPGTLPPTSGYTYALELSLDEAIAAGAAKVEFDKPLPFYVDNFLDFPVGEPVPIGYYDRDKATWVPSINGRIIKILDIVDGKAILDLTGDDIEANQSELDELGISLLELFELGSRYEIGKSIWRVMIEHFTPWDCNWPAGPPTDSVPPPDEAPEQDDENDPEDPCKESGSIIECESQNLGEKIHIANTGLDLVYNTSRVPGRKTGRTIRIKLADDREVPGSLEGIELTIRIAGRKIVKDFLANRDQEYIFVWDGKDVYGREIFGSVTAHIDLAYKYQIRYLAAREDVARSFALPNNDASDSPARYIGQRGNQTLRLTRSYTKILSNNDINKRLGLGGWSLSNHHYYDPQTKTMFKGDGDVIKANNIGEVLDLIYEDRLLFVNLNEFVIGTDGEFYILDYINSAIYKLDSSGNIYRIVGGGDSTEDGATGLDAKIRWPTAIAINNDGEIYFAEYRKIRKLDKFNRVYTVAGDGNVSFNRSPDETLATLANIGNVYDLEFDPEGNLLYSDTFNLIRKIDAEGILSTVAGKAPGGLLGDDMPVANASLTGLTGFDVSNDGSIYLLQSNKVRRVSPDGIIQTIAGQDSSGFAGDGEAAINSKLSGPTDLVQDSVGNLYVLDDGNKRVRIITKDGLIDTYAGNGKNKPSSTKHYDGDFALNASFNYFRGIAIDSVDNVYITEAGGREWLYKISSALPGRGKTNFVLPDKSGREYYVFNKKGRHLKTLDAVTNRLIYEFKYNGQYLTSIQDSFDSETSIERTGKDLEAIVSSYGLQTSVSLDDNGYINSVTNPESETYSMSYSKQGLLSTFTNPRGYSSSMSYDAKGRLVKDENAEGGFWSLLRTGKKRGYELVMQSALGKKVIHNIKKTKDGTFDRSVTRAGTQVNKQIAKKDGTTTLIKADGTIVESSIGPDPRFKLLAPVFSELSATLPSGLKRVLQVSRSATLANQKDLGSLTKFVETKTINGRRSITNYDAATMTVTNSSPEGRIETIQLGENSEILSRQLGSLAKLSYDYDERGRIKTVTRGEAINERVTGFAYDDHGYLNLISDALSNHKSFDRDQIGRVLKEQTNSNNPVSYNYDQNRNLVGLIPPKKEEHGFDYSAVDLLTNYNPPLASNTAANSTNYSYDLDKKIGMISLADSRDISFHYDKDNEELLEKIELARGDIEYSYYDSGQVHKIKAPGDELNNYFYDGFLPIMEDVDGTVDQDYRITYNDNFQVSSRTINGSTAIDFAYDDDGVLSQAGDLSISLNGANALIMGSNLDGLLTHLRYNSFAEPLGYEVELAGATLFSADYNRDKLGRLQAKSETIQGIETDYSYEYDDQNRLSQVLVNGVLKSNYEYDQNNNRIKVNGIQVAQYDEQDRLISYGDSTYTYNPNGDLSSNLTGAVTVNYDYDELGNLVSFNKPSLDIQYLIDGNNRRIAKKLNGNIVQRFLYKDQLEPIAELDASGNIITRYIYGTRPHVPDYMIKAGTKYRIISDNIGSVRLVLEVATGTIAQRLDYDEFGNVILDTNPGFQAFGFAGGIYDTDTKLVKFGARDYDPVIGRWISKDPILFNGGQVNLYVYVANDPVNFVDLSGTAQFGYGFLNIPGTSINIYNTNPIDNFFNTELIHEHLFFEDGSADRGLFPDKVRSLKDKGFEREKYFNKFGPHYDDALMRQAVKNAGDPQYCLIGSNCQDYADKLRDEYERLKQEQESKCGK